MQTAQRGPRPSPAPRSSAGGVGGGVPSGDSGFMGKGTGGGGSPPLDTWLHLKLHIFLSLHFFPRESKHTGVTKHGLAAKPFCY